MLKSCSPLIAACTAPVGAPVVKLLLEAGASPDWYGADVNWYNNPQVHIFYEALIRTSACKSPLLTACALNRPDAVRALLESGASLNLSEGPFQTLTPLSVACALGHLELVEMLLSEDLGYKKANINQKVIIKGDGFRLIKDISMGAAWNQATPLMIACPRQHVQLVNCLLELHANPCETSTGQNIILHALCAWPALSITPNQKTIIKALVDKGGFALLNLKNVRERTALEITFYDKKWAVAKILMEKGGVPDEARDILGWPLVSSKGLSYAELKLLLDYGANPNATNQAQPDTALQLTLTLEGAGAKLDEDDLKRVKLLLVNGANPNQIWRNSGYRPNNPLLVEIMERAYNYRNHDDDKGLSKAAQLLVNYGAHIRDKGELLPLYKKFTYAPRLAAILGGSSLRNLGFESQT